MERIFGFDIGTTSIGFAVINHDPDEATGEIKRLGVRVFPEARDPKGAPLNQERRGARLRRRQLRRRRERRRSLGDLLSEARLLPAYGSDEWNEVMKRDPYELRKRAFRGEALSPREFGRAIYHLSKRRHFKGRDVDEISDDAEADAEKDKEAAADEKKTRDRRDSTIAVLRKSGKTLGAWLSERRPDERRRGEHATREIVKDEFNDIWNGQKKHLAALRDESLEASVREAIFAQRPTFWRMNTLGECRFAPDAPLCPKGAWLSQQRRMLEKLNNLEFSRGKRGPLDAEEHRVILARLQTRAVMTWGGVRAALKPLYRDRGAPGAERRLRFNLEDGGEKKLIGNPLEAKLADIFGREWARHPRRQEIRDAVHERLWRADYGEVGKRRTDSGRLDAQRVVILSAEKRKERRAEAARGFIRDFGITEEQAGKLKSLKLPTGWEPYSTEALRALLPLLEAGERFGALVNGPEWEEWRKETFPKMERPTGEARALLPSPADPEEKRRVAKLRNPTVARARNELRKVANNLIREFGKPDLIRVELAREVGLSKRQREERQQGMRRQEGRRKKAKDELEKSGMADPSRGDVEKWMLWEECGRFCPYTGDPIGFAALFYNNEFDVEHIWPRALSFDNRFGNKTLCRRDVNIEKGARVPFEYIGGDAEEWAKLVKRLEGMKATRGGVGMSPGKIKRFLAREIPEGFTDRQLNDTGYAAREAVSFLKQLWPDRGLDAPVRAQAVSGRVTAHLRRLWGLNNILAENGEKTRDDHRHHAIDALVVACAHPGMTRKLSRYWQDEENPKVRKPQLAPPWAAIRAEAGKAVDSVVVSHRVRKKVSGPLHREMVWGDAKKEETGRDGTIYRYFVTRKKVEDLSKGELDEIRDEDILEIVKDWVEERGGDPKKAFPPYPKRGRKGPEIRKARLLKKRQLGRVARVGTGYADKHENHHIAIYRLPGGGIDFEVISLFDAAGRLSRREDVVKRRRDDGAKLIMSLSPGDALKFPEGDGFKVRIVESVWTSGSVVMVDHDDATRNKRTVARPNPNSILRDGGRKISVDPIGRIRPAKD